MRFISLIQIKSFLIDTDETLRLCILNDKMNKSFSMSFFEYQLLLSSDKLKQVIMLSRLLLLVTHIMKNKKKIVYY